jgi:hypothetical protein
MPDPQKIKNRRAMPPQSSNGGTRYFNGNFCLPRVLFGNVEPTNFGSLPKTEFFKSIQELRTKKSRQ